jgi:hypothetical protein
VTLQLYIYIMGIDYLGSTTSQAVDQIGQESNLSMPVLQHGGYLLYDRQGGRLAAGGGVAQAGQPQGSQGGQGTNPILTSSIEMLMGTGGSSNRVESRLANWSDDGLPPVGIAGEAPGLVAGDCFPPSTHTSNARMAPSPGDGDHADRSAVQEKHHFWLGRGHIPQNFAM